MTTPEIRISLETGVSREIEKRIAEKAYYLSPAITEVAFVQESGGTSLLARLSGETDKATLEGLEERLGAAIQQVTQSFRFVQKETLFERGEGHAPFDRTIIDILIRDGHVVRLMEGGYLYRGLFLKLMHLLDREILAMATELGAHEEEYPSLTPAAPLIKSGYVASFPNQILLAYHLREDVDVLEKFASQNGKESTDGAALEVEQSALSPATQLLTPAVCYNCFASLSGQSVPDRGRVVTALGSCHRYEYRNLHDLERLQSFRMREIIFMGGEEFVTKCREDLLNAAKSLVERFDIECAIMKASDPFFTDISLGKRTFQEIQNLKYELVVPIGGAYDDSLAVASFNLHQTNMAESYGIQLDSGAPMYSGCVGYGFERFCFAFLARHGLKPDLWPSHVRDGFAVVP